MFDWIFKIAGVLIVLASFLYMKEQTSDTRNIVFGVGIFVYVIGALISFQKRKKDH